MLASSTASGTGTPNASALLPTALAVLGLNVVLMLVKLGVGYAGNSYALIADGVESASDIFVSVLTWGGFLLSMRPPDRDHPFGHGKIESLVGIVSGLALLVAAGFIAVSAVHEILRPHHAPAWYTLPVLLAVVASKEWLFKRVMKLSEGGLDSRALEGDARHHYADALTSGAAFIGISVALLGGAAYASADDWAALVACAVVAWNGGSLLRDAFHDVMDGAVEPDRTTEFRREAETVPGVWQVETCRARKSGVGYFVEIHAIVDGDISVRQGHEIAHQIKERLAAGKRRIIDTVVHIEPSPRGQTPPSP